VGTTWRHCGAAGARNNGQMMRCHPARLLAIASWGVLSAFASADLKFSVTFPEEALSEAFTGRVVVFLGKGTVEPRFGPNWFNPEPMFAADFRGVRPGQAMLISDANAIGFPGRIGELAEGEYTIQAVIDRNLGGRAIGSSPGNLYSAPVRLRLSGKESQTVTLVSDRVVADRPFVDSPAVRGVRIESKLLSEFHRRPTHLQAAVVLPEEWDLEPDRRFPVIYSISGFGGSHMSWSGRDSRRGTQRAGEPFIVVHLDANCPTGHSVFADSDNNGPWGRALTTELIPHVEESYRGWASAAGRFVTGHSSGGWSSLWLQVTYPDLFGGVWSTAPDPVDFRDFQRIHLYQAGTNMFVDERGEPRPLARRGDRVALLYKQFSDMERPLRGEQLGSFEGVFSPRGSDGQPMKLWNRDTGEIDPKVAEAWKRYDIGLILRTRWSELEPKLRGKLHVYMADMDTFYLEGAVKLLIEDMKALGAREKIELVPGDHGSMLTPALMRRIDEEMAAQFRRAK
jgi:pimeloyl-ACP methyl ester carboxylesterase